MSPRIESTEAVMKRLLAFVSSEFARGRAVGPDEPLLDGLVDSLGLFALVQFVERDFGVALPDTDLSIENFSTARRLAALVERRSAGADT